MPKRFPREHYYWLVGAFWDQDMTEAFFRRGYWELGWRDRDQPGMAQQRDSMRPGDRIAVKALRGPGKKTITIKGLGIVKELADDKRVYVQWLVTDLLREVPSHGCYGTIHGPFSPQTDGEWLGIVFRL